MIPAPVQAAVDVVAEDVSSVGLTVLSAVVAVFAAKFLLRAVAMSSARAGLLRLFGR